MINCSFQAIWLWDVIKTNILRGFSPNRILTLGESKRVSLKLTHPKFSLDPRLEMSSCSFTNLHLNNLHHRQSFDTQFFNSLILYKIISAFRINCFPLPELSTIYYKVPCVIYMQFLHTILKLSFHSLAAYINVLRSLFNFCIQCYTANNGKESINNQ